MTVTITNGHGILVDCNRTSGGSEGTWAETEDGNVGATSVLHGDIFDINIASSGGNKVYYWSNGTNIGISSNTYTKALFHYKTSSTSIKAKIMLEFSDASTQTILDETDSVTWASGSVTVTEDKTIDHIHLYANQATGHVYYDFILLHEGTFTFPGIGPGQIRLDVNRKKPAHEAPSRDGDIEQDLGMKSPEIVLSGTLLEGESWGTPNFEKLYRIVRDSDRWQWFTCDRPYIRCKASVQGITLLNIIGDNTSSLGWELRLKQYSLSSLGESTWDNLQWFGYES